MRKGTKRFFDEGIRASGNKLKVVKRNEIITE
jgi:hypothetical protein